MSQYFIGVDIGGTNVKLGVVDGRGKVVARTSFATGLFAGAPALLIDAVVDAVQGLAAQKGLSKKTVAGVGVGLPGLVDVDRGIVRLLPNIIGWVDVPLRRILERSLGLKVQLENDVNLITLGEWEYGAGRGLKNVICMTLGTGVGAGLILNGAIYRGPGFAAGEIGHAPLNETGPKCGCGSWGCFEQYVGNRCLQKNAARLFGRPDITLEDIYDAALRKQKKALKFWEDTGVKVAAGLIGPINILNPECIIIGGGVSASFEFMRPAIEKTIKRRCMKIQAGMVRIIRAQLGSDAGLIGAKVLVSHEKK